MPLRRLPLGFHGLALKLGSSYISKSGSIICDVSIDDIFSIRFWGDDGQAHWIDVNLENIEGAVITFSGMTTADGERLDDLDIRLQDYAEYGYLYHLDMVPKNEPKTMVIRLYGDESKLLGRDLFHAQERKRRKVNKQLGRISMSGAWDSPNAQPAKLWVGAEPGVPEQKHSPSPAVGLQIRRSQIEADVVFSDDAPAPLQQTTAVLTLSKGRPSGPHSNLPSPIANKKTRFASPVVTSYTSPSPRESQSTGQSQANDDIEHKLPEYPNATATADVSKELEQRTPVFLHESPGMASSPPPAPPPPAPQGVEQPSRTFSEFVDSLEENPPAPQPKGSIKEGLHAGMRSTVVKSEPQTPAHNKSISRAPKSPRLGKRDSQAEMGLYDLVPDDYKNDNDEAVLPEMLQAAGRGSKRKTPVPPKKAPAKKDTVKSKIFKSAEVVEDSSEPELGMNHQEPMAKFVTESSGVKNTIPTVKAAEKTPPKTKTEGEPELMEVVEHAAHLPRPKATPIAGESTMSKAALTVEKATTKTHAEVKKEKVSKPIEPIEHPSETEVKPVTRAAATSAVPGEKETPSAKTNTAPKPKVIYDLESIVPVPAPEPKRKSVEPPPPPKKNIQAPAAGRTPAPKTVVVTKKNAPKAPPKPKSTATKPTTQAKAPPRGKKALVAAAPVIPAKRPVEAPEESDSELPALSPVPEIEIKVEKRDAVGKSQRGKITPKEAPTVYVSPPNTTPPKKKAKITDNAQNPPQRSASSVPSNHETFNKHTTSLILGAIAMAGDNYPPRASERITFTRSPVPEGMEWNPMRVKSSSLAPFPDEADDGAFIDLGRERAVVEAEVELDDDASELPKPATSIRVDSSSGPTKDGQEVKAAEIKKRLTPPKTPVVRTAPIKVTPYMQLTRKIQFEEPKKRELPKRNALEAQQQPQVKGISHIDSEDRERELGVHRSSFSGDKIEGPEENLMEPSDKGMEITHGDQSESEEEIDSNRLSADIGEPGIGDSLQVGGFPKPKQREHLIVAGSGDEDIIMGNNFGMGGKTKTKTAVQPAPRRRRTASATSSSVKGKY